MKLLGKLCCLWKAKIPAKQKVSVHVVFYLLFCYLLIKLLNFILFVLEKSRFGGIVGFQDDNIFFDLVTCR
uniref:Ovule protein n=1 Tax=Strongyloides venezuelensis TaxID=75913 RepID=A0A0K0FHK0_STRVS